MKKVFLLILLFFNSHAFGFKDPHSNINVFFDVLMWQAREVSDDNWAQILGPTGSYQEIEFLDVPFKWSPGFKVGVGYHDKNSNPWDFIIYYTNYKARGTNHANINSGEIHSAFSGNFYANNPAGDGISGPYYRGAAIQWDILFKTLDLELGRTIEINTLLDLRPFAGLIAAVINQDIDSNWQDPYEPTTILNPLPTPITTFTSATETITNHFKGVGPSFGLDTTWHLHETPKHSINLIGNFAAAILFGEWRLADIYQNNTPVSIATVNDTLLSAATMAKGYLGVEWEHAFKNAHCKVGLGYEGQVWFSQLKYYTFDMGKLNDALFLRGAVLDFWIHF